MYKKSEYKNDSSFLFIFRFSNQVSRFASVGDSALSLLFNHSKTIDGNVSLAE